MEKSMSEPSSLPNQPTPVAASAAALASDVLSRGEPEATENTAIRPFHINIPEAEITELKRRIEATRWPEREAVADESQGVRLKTIQELARYWADEYDWRKIESRLSSYPNFITEIDGLDFHFIHVRSKHDNAMPLLIAHGWPGSIVEQVKLIEPLTDPTAHGGSEADAFHVVIPSMPGYGFSGKPTTTDWNPQRIAHAYAELMSRLGYEKYAAQGGDWGRSSSTSWAFRSPKDCSASTPTCLR
jgi:hypothetical protein